MHSIHALLQAWQHCLVNRPDAGPRSAPDLSCIATRETGMRRVIDWLVRDRIVRRLRPARRSPWEALAESGALSAGGIEWLTHPTP